jgi:hypothetical protein
VAVGIMIVVLTKYGGDMETGNQSILTNTENLKVGNIIEKHNGKQCRRV